MWKPECSLLRGKKFQVQAYDVRHFLASFVAVLIPSASGAASPGKGFILHPSGICWSEYVGVVIYLSQSPIESFIIPTWFLLVDIRRNSLNPISHLRKQLPRGRVKGNGHIHLRTSRSYGSSSLSLLWHGILDMLCYDLTVCQVDHSIGQFGLHMNCTDRSTTYMDGRLSMTTMGLLLLRDS